MRTIRVVAPVVAGVAVVGLVSVAKADSPDARIGVAFLLIPYVAYAVAARRTPTVPWLVLFAVLVASTLAGLAAAGSSSTGGLVFLWLLPLQWSLSVVAGYLGHRASRPARA